MRRTNCRIERLPFPARPFWKVFNDSVSRWVQVSALKLACDVMDVAIRLFAPPLRLRADAKAVPLNLQKQISALLVPIKGIETNARFHAGCFSAIMARQAAKTAKNTGDSNTRNFVLSYV